METRKQIEEILLTDYGCFDDFTVDKLLDLLGVSGMFSSEKLEQAYKDGVRDSLAKGYGTFDEENYR
jgi:hypothetical protein